MDWTAFQRELGAGRIRPVYLFSGREDYLAEEGVRALVDRLLTPEERTLNLITVYGEDAEGLPDALATSPLLGKRWVVVVRRAEALSGRPLEAAVRYAASPPANGCLILCAGKVDMRRSLFKKLAGSVDPVDCSPVTGRRMAKWIREYIKRAGKRIEAEAVGRLTAVHWPSLRDLAGELDRLVLMVGDEPALKAADIEEMGGTTFALEVWRLTDAVGSGDLQAAAATLENLRRWNVKPVQIIGSLFRFYQKLWLIKWSQEHRRVGEVRKRVGLLPFLFDRYSNFAKSTDIKRIEAGVVRILDADLGVKSGVRSGEVEIPALVSDLIRTVKG